MTEEERHRARLAARTEALADELLALEEVCGVFVEQAARAGCAAKDLRLEFDPASPSDGNLNIVEQIVGREPKSRDSADPWLRRLATIVDVEHDPPEASDG